MHTLLSHPLNAGDAIPNATLINLAVALGIGLLIGLERERQKGSTNQHQPAGIRTFALVGLFGALSSLLGLGILAAALLGVAGLAIAAYLRSGQDEIGLTSEVTLLLTLVLGAWAMILPALAAGLGVLVVVLLAARQPLHRFVLNVLTDRELHELLLLAIATLLILPLIPPEPIGPWQAIHPRSLWIVVIAMMAIGGSGHIALRLLGSRWGLPLTGLFGGFVSSTATIGAMGVRARQTPTLLQPAIAGAVFSTVGTMVQLAMVLAITSLPTLKVMAWSIVCGGAAALAVGAWMMWHTLRDDSPANETLGSAFNHKTALMLAALLAGVSLLTAWLNQRFGHAGLAVGMAFAGFADTHAPAVSVATLVTSGTLQAEAAAFPILLAFTSNTLAKILSASFTGGRAFALRVIPGVLWVVTATWLGWWVSK